MNYQAKLSEKYMTALYCISNFADTSYKMLHDTLPVLLFLDVLHQ